MLVSSLRESLICGRLVHLRLLRFEELQGVSLAQSAWMYVSLCLWNCLQFFYHFVVSG